MKKRIIAFILCFLICFTSVSEYQKVEAVAGPAVVEGVSNGAMLLYEIFVALGIDMTPLTENYEENSEEIKTWYNFAYYYAGEQLKADCDQIAENWDTTQDSVVKVSMGVLTQAVQLAEQLYLSAGEDFVLGNWTHYSLDLSADGVISWEQIPEFRPNISNYKVLQDSYYLGSSALILGGNYITASMNSGNVITFTKNGETTVNSSIAPYICSTIPAYRTWGAYAQFSYIQLQGSTVKLVYQIVNTNGSLANVYNAYTWPKTSFGSSLPISVYPGDALVCGPESTAIGEGVDMTGLVLHLPKVGEGMTTIPYTPTHARVTDLPADTVAGMTEDTVYTRDAISSSVPTTFPDTATTDETANKFKVPAEVLMTKFPFCIPFDVMRTFETLKAPAVTPRWTIPFDFPRFGIDEEIVIDFEQFDVLASIMRWFFSIIFLLGLILVTRKLIM